MIHTGTSRFLVKPLMDPESRTATVAGSDSVDCLGYTRAVLMLHIGAHDRTTGNETLDVKLQESSDDGSTDTYADVSGAAFAQIAAQVPNANKGSMYLMNIDLTKRERYLRVYCTAAGTTPIDLYAVSIILLNPEQEPPTQDFTVISV